MTTNEPTRSILIVEDEPALLEVTCLNVESLGYSVQSANSPLEALEILKSGTSTIWLLITDVVMPEMNGKRLFEAAVDLVPDLLCLYVSGYPADIVGKRGIIPEEVHFLEKPFTRAQLKENIETIQAEGA